MDSEEPAPHVCFFAASRLPSAPSPSRNVPSRAALPIIRPALGRQQSISDRAKVAMQGYLNHFLGNLDIVNSPEDSSNRLLLLKISWLPPSFPSPPCPFYTSRSPVELAVSSAFCSRSGWLSALLFTSGLVGLVVLSHRSARGLLVLSQRSLSFRCGLLVCHCGLSLCARLATVVCCCLSLLRPLFQFDQLWSSQFSRLNPLCLYPLRSNLVATVSSKLPRRGTQDLLRVSGGGREKRQWLVSAQVTGKPFGINTKG
ncbi:Phospholipase D p2 [Platanthera guangdongensis]|uniref:Phospholipase D p2 n=1 Tax=Platanthera guangdongensis TaxID=2320717 RepID=A0ABR2MAQ5_9ASPA